MAKRIFTIIWDYKYAASLLLLLSLLTYTYFTYFVPKKDISYYYDIIKTQERVEDSFVITEEEKAAVLACTKKQKSRDGISSEDCLRDYYTQYTVKYGPEQGFEHLAAVQKEFPKLLPGCHYISHGMGHGTVRREGGDVYKAFDIMLSSNYFKNIATCGNGYFHGVVEEYAKDVHTKESFITKLKPVCEARKTNCHHGVGHALVSQFGFDRKAIDDALFVCDAITDKPQERFGCYTGVFMEVNQQDDSVATVVNGKLVFHLCDSYDRPYKTACYLEESSMFEKYSKDRSDYSQNISYCKQIESDLERMACVKLNAIRAVRIVRYEDVSRMCSQTSSDVENVMCSAIIASRAGGSIDKTYKSNIYQNAIKDVCMTAGPVLGLRCLALAREHSEQLFYVSEADLTMPKITKKTLQNLFAH